MKDLQLLTCGEVARVLRVSSETVRQLAASGELPGRKIGRAWRFPQVAIKSFVFDTPTQVAGAETCFERQSEPDESEFVDQNQPS